ncbi:14128_t:CDS:2 [Acaulospora morrowiae]|uniref:14128_t:CDS:1 n=1 Tax=Acaulospora morrowiae TaxID=94023 RepID=A0A9N9AGI3_9GLOM|nr:14128_t:CDS:2 [Acaulospora morrowiae]
MLGYSIKIVKEIPLDLLGPPPPFNRLSTNQWNEYDISENERSTGRINLMFKTIDHFVKVDYRLVVIMGKLKSLYQD